MEVSGEGSAFTSLFSRFCVVKIWVIGIDISCFYLRIHDYVVLYFCLYSATWRHSQAKKMHCHHYSKCDTFSNSNDLIGISCRILCEDHLHELQWVNSDGSYYHVFSFFTLTIIKWHENNSIFFFKNVFHKICNK